MDQNIERRITELLSQMTVREKIGQLNQVNNPTKRDAEFEKLCASGDVGSFILNLIGTYYDTSEGAEEIRGVINEFQRCAVEGSRMGIPIIFGRDVIHGFHTMYPNPIALAASFNPALVEKSYRCIAKEAANCGVHWTFAPMVDRAQDPRWGRCVEGPGEDPYLGSKMAAAEVRGLQGDDLSKRDSIVACAKHYVGYGGAEGGRDYHKAEISDQTLRNYYFPNFRAAVEAGCGTVMNAFNDISGVPAASNRYLLTDVLRGEMGFDGFVISDDHAIVQLVRHGVAEDEAEAAAMALNAGLDMDMRDGLYINHLEELIDSGRVSTETLDESVRRVLRIKFRAGLFDHPYTVCVPVDYDAHQKVSREIADETVVLLKNNGVLPLSKKTCVGILGSIQSDRGINLGCWASDYDLKRIKTFEEGMHYIAPDAPIQSFQGTYIDVMLAFLRDPEVIVLALGESPYVSGENANMANIELPEEQKVLIEKAKRTGKKLVGVVMSGRPLALETVEPYLDAIVWAWQNGTEGAAAAAAVLYGDVNPSGKLSMTLPRVIGQIPLYYNQTTSCRQNEGYYSDEPIRNYRDTLGSPLYPFGYGLSYTTFEYSDLKADEDKISINDILSGKSFRISVRVKNTGDREGKETSQCYIHDCVAQITRPIRELKGFVKENYKPGEEKTVTFELSEKELGYWNTEKKYVVEPGKFKIFVGGDCLTKDEITVEITK